MRNSFSDYIIRSLLSIFEFSVLKISCYTDIIDSKGLIKELMKINY